MRSCLLGPRALVGLGSHALLPELCDLFHELRHHGPKLGDLLAQRADFLIWTGQWVKAPVGERGSLSRLARWGRLPRLSRLPAAT